MRLTTRQFAAMVDAPHDDAIRWVLIEASGEHRVWIEIEKNKSFSGTCHVGMAPGLLALQRHIEELDIGPHQAPPEPTRVAKPGRAWAQVSA